jgi:urease accessory protein
VLVQPAGLRSPASGAPPDRGQARLVFARDGRGRSYLREQFASYPFHLCRPHRFEGDPPGMAAVYLQSSSGGIYQHDRLCLAIAAAERAQAHVTTQAATIVHGMSSGHAEQRVSIRAGAGCLLEYLPDPMILFPGSRLSCRLAVRADPGATVILGEAFFCHDPEGRHRAFDWLLNEISVEAGDSSLLARERYQVSGEAFAARTPGLSGGMPAEGCVHVIAPERGAPLLDALREAIMGIPGVQAGASELPNACGVWARVLARDGQALRRALASAWAAARRACTGQAPAPRRK